MAFLRHISDFQNKHLYIDTLVTGVRCSLAHQVCLYFWEFTQSHHSESYQGQFGSSVLLKDIQSDVRTGPPNSVNLLLLALILIQQWKSSSQPWKCSKVLLFLFECFLYGLLHWLLVRPPTWLSYHTWTENTKYLADESRFEVAHLLCINIPPSAP